MRKKVNKLLIGILLIILVIFSITCFTQKEVNKIMLNPLKQGEANNLVFNLYSDNKEILNRILNEYNRANKENAEEPKWSSNEHKLYQITLKNSGFLNIYSLDFSSIDLSKMTRSTIPYFPSTNNIGSINFQNCKIEDGVAFCNNCYDKLNSIVYIDLQNNKLKKIDKRLLKGKKYDLRNQKLAYYIGSYEIGYKKSVPLPDYFANENNCILYKIEKNSNGEFIIDTSKSGNNLCGKVTINDNGSQFDGSSVIYYYNVREKSTNFVDLGSNNSGSNNSGSNNSGNNNLVVNNPPQVITMTLNASYSCSPSGYASSKSITTSLTGENVDVSKAVIYVNNERIGNNNGIGTYTVTKNGYYTVLVKYPGLDNQQYTFNVENIDSEKPSYVINLSKQPNSNSIFMNLYAQDNVGVKSVDINGNNVYQYTSGAVYVGKNMSYEVKKTGTYTVTVTDFANNKYSKTENIVIDNAPPTILNASIVKITESVITNNSDNQEGKCYVTNGDKIRVSLKTNEKVQSYNGISINRHSIESGLIQVNKDEISFEVNINDIFDNGELQISIFNVTDEWGNSTSLHINDILYYDNIKPIIKEVNIFGGKKSNDNEVVELLKSQKITIDVVCNELLNDDILINIADYVVKAKYEASNSSEGNFLYRALLNTDDLIIQLEKIDMKNAYIPISIKDYIDKAGNKGEDINIDEDNKSSNGLCLVYGLVQQNKIYIVSKSNISKMKGDINSDWYITEYDSMLLRNFLAGLTKLSRVIPGGADINSIKEIYGEAPENISYDELLNNPSYIYYLEYADINSDGKLDIMDITALESLTKKTRNALYEQMTFVTYNEKGELLRNVQYEIVKGNKLVEIIENEDSSITVKKIQTSINEDIVIRATYIDDYVKSVGEISFIATHNYGNIADFKVLNEYNNDKRLIIGDLNDDGFITQYDATCLQYKLLEQEEVADKEIANVFYDDLIDINDVTQIQIIAKEKYNGLKRGTNLRLEYSDDKNEFLAENASCTWEVMGENSDDITISQIDNNIATITVNESANVGDRVTVMCKAFIKDTNIESIALFNIIVIDEPQVKLNLDVINYDLSKESNLEVLKVYTDLANKELIWKTNNNKIADIEVDEYGNAKVIPIGVGTTSIEVDVDGTKAFCQVNVTASMTEINTNISKCTIKETKTKEFDISINPIYSTDTIIAITENESIVSVYYDKQKEKYVILGNKEGTTNIKIASASNQEIYKNIEVTVEKLEAPHLVNIKIDNEESKIYYKSGDVINFEFEFSDEVIGDEPSLQIGFGKYVSNGETEFIGFDQTNKKLKYKYVVKDGDNGALFFYKLNGGTLTDVTKTLNADLAVQKEDFYKSEDFKVYDENDQINIDEEINGNIESNDQMISQGIYIGTDSIIADTIKATVTVTPDVDKNSCWLTVGDIARIKITTSEILSNVPTVIMGGKEVEVTGEGTEFYASLNITKDIPEGYLSIVIKDYKDLAGNTGDVIDISNENIDEPIIVDYSGSKVSRIEVISENNKNYKEGDSFDIVIHFADMTKDRIEYISANILPELKIKFGENDAKGKLISTYQLGEYVDYIKYTYTISSEDEGNMTIVSYKGDVEDIAGNKTHILMDISDNKNTNLTVNKEEEKTEDKEEEKTEDKEEEKAENKEEEKTEDKEEEKTEDKEEEKTEDKEEKTEDKEEEKTENKEEEKTEDKEEKTEDKEEKTEDKNNQRIEEKIPNQSTNMNTPNNIFNGALPYTGKAICGIIVLAIGLIVLVGEVWYIKRK